MGLESNLSKAASCLAQAINAPVTFAGMLVHDTGRSAGM